VLRMKLVLSSITLFNDFFKSEKQYISMRNKVKYVHIDIPINTGTNFGLMLSDGLFFCVDVKENMIF
jgi:hypothetical protein